MHGQKPHYLRARLGSAAGRSIAACWLISLVASIGLGLACVIYSWSGLPIHFAGAELYISLYPPLTICTLWVIWFGFWSGAIPAYLATFTLALHSGMPLTAALVFAFANPLGLAVFALAYRSMPVRYDLRTGRSLAFFTLLSFIAGVFSSAGSFIWTYTNQLGVQDVFAIWQGWWLGSFLQTLFCVAPLLWLFSRPLRNWKRRHRLEPAKPIPTTKNTLTISGLMLAGLASYLLINLHLERELLRLAEASNNRVQIHQVVQMVIDSTEALIWVVLVALGFLVFFGLRLFGHWTAALHREIAQRRAVQDRLEQQNLFLSKASQLSSELQSATTLDAALDRLQQRLPDLLPNSQGALFLRGPDGHLQRRVHWGADAARLSALDEESLAAPLPNEQAVCLALQLNEQPFGTLWLSELPALLAENPDLSQMLVEQLALPLGNRKLQDQLQHQAVHDPLTGLYNRRHMQRWLQHELTRSQRSHQPLSALLVDVDHFKQLNDRYGHAIGDLVLQRLGHYLEQHVRRQDLCCRYGGEEFLLLLTDTDGATALERAEALRQGVARLQIKVGAQPLPDIQISVGIACYPDHAEDGNQLLAAADTALYHSKRTGRNRCSLATTHTNEAPTELV
ncbi:sensor domain-containing diguanylate cyclase [Marinobacterium arenosum]|uniref:sensor domain-containing diguanylate cyclase n=1 Tax=Marinobacterium arenosum TaxID=2862496 RepID=UPI001C93F602|nr:diguanylate cyclase [Marinobacterium arenosum]MBY4677495.1 diguanylate cyclase [Marinobacterium arenosum]